MEALAAALEGAAGALRPCGLGGEPGIALVEKRPDLRCERPRRSARAREPLDPIEPFDQPSRRLHSSKVSGNVCDDLAASATNFRRRVTDARQTPRQ